MRHLLVLSVLLVLVAGCGSTHTSAPALKTYKDPNFNFSFRYPGNWSVPSKGGRETNVGTVKTYIVDISIPNNQASMQVTVDGAIQPFPAFVDGKISPDPGGGPDFFHYTHATVSGLPAMHVERWSGKMADEIDTFVNTQTRAYDIRMNAATPPFPQDIRAGYDTIVKSMKLPFS